MKVVILCGGKGTRLREYTEEIPKPLIEIGRKPILWHIMKIYSYWGYRDFILCLGYKGRLIEEYFKNNELDEKWSIELVDTGEDTSKGQRIRMIKKLILDDNFFVAYGDDVSDVNINKLFEFHKEKGKIATLTTVNLISQFGILKLNNNDEIVVFKEKPRLDHWINGGFFVFRKEIFDYIKEGYDLEEDTFRELAKINQICAFKHSGFWQCMNTLKDTIELNEAWEMKKAPWKLW